jgi:hypothetical protein
MENRSRKSITSTCCSACMQCRAVHCSQFHAYIYACSAFIRYHVICGHMNTPSSDSHSSQVYEYCSPTDSNGGLDEDIPNSSENKPIQVLNINQFLQQLPVDVRVKYPIAMPSSSRTFVHHICSVWLVHLLVVVHYTRHRLCVPDQQSDVPKGAHGRHQIRGLSTHQHQHRNQPTAHAAGAQRGQVSRSQLPLRARLSLP